MILKTLRIKKIYLNQIKSGEKKFEYRSDKDYYEWLGSIDVPFLLQLHYQTSDRLFCKVTAVKKIKTPDFCSIIDTPKCWKLSIQVSK